MRVLASLGLALVLLSALPAYAAAVAQGEPGRVAHPDPAGGDLAMGPVVTVILLRLPAGVASSDAGAPFPLQGEAGSFAGALGADTLGTVALALDATNETVSGTAGLFIATVALTGDLAARGLATAATVASSQPAWGTGAGRLGQGLVHAVVLLGEGSVGVTRSLEGVMDDPAEAVRRVASEGGTLLIVVTLAGIEALDAFLFDVLRS